MRCCLTKEAINSLRPRFPARTGTVTRKGSEYIYVKWDGNLSEQQYHHSYIKILTEDEEKALIDLKNRQKKLDDEFKILAEKMYTIQAAQ